MKSKKADSIFASPIFLIAGLIVVFISIYFIVTRFGGFDDVSACKINNGNLIVEECNEKYANSFPLGDTDEGNCCKRKSTVPKSLYETWIQEETTPVITDDERDDPNVIPVRTSGTIENIIVDPNKVEAGAAYIAFNGKEYTTDAGLQTIPLNGKLVVSATHNQKDGKYCHLYIVEAQRSGDGFDAKRTNGIISPLASMSYKNSNCAPTETGLVQLQIDSAIGLPGYYKADYLVKESETGKTLISKTVVFEVTNDVSDPEAERKGLAPIIKILLSQDSRTPQQVNQLYCWVTVDINTQGRVLPDHRIQTGKTTSTCTSATYTDYNFGGGPTQLAPSEQFCIKVEQEYIDANGVSRTRLVDESYPQKECDYVQVFFDSQPTTGCTETCEDYTGKLATQCLSYTQRSSGCQYSRDCYEKGGSCQTCDSTILSCPGYRNQESCEANQCLQNQRCMWVDGFLKVDFLGGKCVPYSDQST